MCWARKHRSLEGREGGEKIWCRLRKGAPPWRTQASKDQSEPGENLSFLEKGGTSDNFKGTRTVEKKTFDGREGVDGDKWGVHQHLRTLQRREA